MHAQANKHTYEKRNQQKDCLDLEAEVTQQVPGRPEGSIVDKGFLPSVHRVGQFACSAKFPREKRTDPS